MVSLVFLSYAALGLYQKPTIAIVPVSGKKPSFPSVLSKEPNYGLPARLKVPKIKIDTQITYMGLTKDGDMAVPTNVVDVGWYKYGPLPGNKGSAVIAGHLDGLRGEPGVFINLSKLQKGDQIMVVDDKQQTVSFVVRETRTYDQNEQPSEVFNATVGDAHLNLITCTGTWDKVQHRFAKRLVVFADKV